MIHCHKVIHNRLCQWSSMTFDTHWYCISTMSYSRLLPALRVCHSNDLFNAIRSLHGYINFIPATKAMKWLGKQPHIFSSINAAIIACNCLTPFLFDVQWTCSGLTGKKVGQKTGMDFSCTLHFAKFNSKKGKRQNFSYLVAHLKFISYFPTLG